MMRKEHAFLKAMGVFLLFLAGVGLWVTYLTYFKTYGTVTFPQGNVAIVKPNPVQEGESIIITYPAYCNYGTDVTVERFIDVFDKTGFRSASIPINSITFYFKPGTEVCREPEVQEVPLPVEAKAYGGVTTTYAIRSETIYKPNKVSTVVVESTTQKFQVEQ